MNNIVIFLSDEESNTLKYESEEMKIWRRQNMPMRKFFTDNGITLNN